MSELKSLKDLSKEELLRFIVANIDINLVTKLLTCSIHDGDNLEADYYYICDKCKKSRKNKKS